MLSDCDMLGIQLGISTEKLLLGDVASGRGGQEAVRSELGATFTPPQSAQCSTMHVAEIGKKRSCSGEG